jgi:hypothetical protein
MLFTNVHNALNKVAWTILKIKCQSSLHLKAAHQQCFFLGEFSQSGDKIKGLANSRKGFLRFKKKSLYLDEIFLESPDLDSVFM